jgi:hypothetical protein
MRAALVLLLAVAPAGCLALSIGTGINSASTSGLTSPAMGCMERGECLLLSLGVGGAIQLQESSDGGVSWSEPRATGATGATSVAISCAGPAVCVTVWQVSNTVVHSSSTVDGGASWSGTTSLSPADASSINRPQVSCFLPSTSAVTTVSCVATWTPVSGTIVYTARTTTSGATWAAPLATSSSLTLSMPSVSCASGLCVLALRSGSNGASTIRVTRSTDGGASWSALSTIAKSTWNEIDALEPNVACASAVSCLITAEAFDGNAPRWVVTSRSSNGGASWTAMADVGYDTFKNYHYVRPRLSCAGSNCAVLWHVQAKVAGNTDTRPRYQTTGNMGVAWSTTVLATAVLQISVAAGAVSQGAVTCQPTRGNCALAMQQASSPIAVYTGRLPGFTFAATALTPTAAPTVEPTTAAPSQVPSAPSPAPSKAPTAAPTTAQPTAPTAAPSKAPSAAPTAQPSKNPSKVPSKAPSAAPTAQPSSKPTSQPTSKPSKQPSKAPSKAPSAAPTARPSKQPSKAPSKAPSAAPTAQPTVQPTAQPSSKPTSQPTSQPSKQPSAAPSAAPTAAPTAAPITAQPTAPTAAPSAAPSAAPTAPTASSSPTQFLTRTPTGLRENEGTNNTGLLASMGFIGMFALIFGSWRVANYLKTAPTVSVDADNKLFQARRSVSSLSTFSMSSQGRASPYEPWSSPSSELVPPPPGLSPRPNYAPRTFLRPPSFGPSFRKLSFF